MDIRNVVIDAKKTIGSKLMLVDVIPSYVYADGNRTDEVSGFKYVVAMPEHALDKLSIKIDGDLQIAKPEIDFPEVIFDGLEMSVYWTPSGYQLAAKATAIRTVEAKKKTQV